MARKEKKVVVPDFPGTENRDKDKVFKIVEMPADQAERWAIRALLAVTRANPDLSDLKDIESLGWQGIAKLGLKFIAGLDFEVAAPLLDEMMTCVRIVRDPRYPEVAQELKLAGDIEEPTTRAWLRSEVLRLHTGFSPADALSALLMAVMERRPETSGTT